MKLKQQLIPSSKYSLKSPHVMKPIGITVHNTANDASAKNEIAYMVSNSNLTSYHIAVDDIEAIQAIPFNRNAWHAGDGGNGSGNRKHIGLEICYSKSGGARFDKAEENTVKVIVDLMKQYKWTMSDIRRHKDHSGKNCPHRTMAKGWERFLNMIRKELGNTAVSESSNIYYGINSPHNTKESVQTLQQNLVKLKYSVGSYGANGVMGNDTKNAILAFQKANKLTQDGFAGQDTLDKIKQLLDAQNVVLPPKPVIKPTTVIYYGINSPHNTKSAIQKLQEDLVTLGYSVGSYGANGVMGNDTKDAIITFQKAYQLSMDGFAGQTTLTRIESLIEEKNKPKPVSPVDEGLYRVQTGAFSDKTNADKLAEELKEKGFNAVIKKD